MNLSHTELRNRLPHLFLLLSAVAVVHSTLCYAQELHDQAPELTRIVPSGVGHYSPQKWATLAVEVVNRSSASKDVVVATYFLSQPATQYGRRIWLPPRCRRRVSIPVLPPGDAAPENGRYEIRTMLLDASEGSGTIVRSEDGRMLEGGLLPADRRPILTKMISDRDHKSDSAVREVAIAARISTGRSRLISEFHDAHLPETSPELQGMDQLILSGDHVAEDISGLAAIRRWLHSGGRLWVMLDQLEPETVGLLLGESFDSQFVDRVSLTDVRLEGVGDQEEFSTSATRSFEEPVDLVRMIVSDVDVDYTVNGWPAAFWQKTGHGEILFTTLGARGWMRSRKPSDPKPRDAQFTSSFVGVKPMQMLSDRFFQPRRTSPVEPEQLEPILSEQIGYRIISRRTAVAILASFSAGVLVAGILLLRRKRLELLGWFGPAAAACTALVIGLLGASSRSGVPNTLAELQFVQTICDSDDLHVTGLASLYYRNHSKEVISAERSGVLLPNSDDSRGSVSRMLWTDMDSWRWQNLTLPPGAQSAPFEFTAKSTTTVRATGAFGPAGFEGSVAADSAEDLSDAIIGTPSREHLAVEIDTDGTFVASADRVLAPGQFIADTLLSDKQRRRQDVYRRLIPSASETVYPDRPMLLAWTRPVSSGFQFPEQTRRFGSALFVFPLKITRTPPGTHVSIPSPFLPYRTDKKTVSSSLYVNRTGEWVERQTSAKTWLRVQFPVAVLPIRLDQIIVTVRIRGPVSRIAIAADRDGETAVLASRDSPVGAVKLFADPGDALVMDNDGGIKMGVLVTVSEANVATDQNLDAGQINLWKIDSLRVEAEGQTVAP